MNKKLFFLLFLIIPLIIVPCFAKQISLKQYLVRANAYSEKGALEKAMQTYNAALQEYPDSGEFYAGRAGIYLRQNDYVEALKDINKALEIKPDMDEAYICRAMVYMELKEYEKSLSDVEKAEALGSKDMFFWSIDDLKQQIRSHLSKEELGQYERKKQKKILANNLPLLDSADVSVRVKAVEELGQSNDSNAVDPLVRIMKSDPVLQVRAEAASALGNIKDPRSTDALIKMLKSKNTAFLSHVTYALGNLKDRRAVKPLIATLEKANENVQADIINALGEIKDPEVVPILLFYTKGKDAYLKSMAELAIGKITGEVLSGDE